MREIILMLHATTGILGVLASLWVFVDVLNINSANLLRIKVMSVVTAVMIWLTSLLGGFWYVTYYGRDKAIIKAGPWDFAHSIGMETKEHLFFTLLLLATYLPVAALTSRLIQDKSAKLLILLCSCMIVFLGLAMEGGGAIVGIGMKLGLLEGGV